MQALRGKRGDAVVSESPAPYIAAEIIVGIDPGKLTGVAVYNRKTRRLIAVGSSSFWDAIDLVRGLRKNHGAAMMVRIEDPNLIKRPMYRRLDSVEGKNVRENMAAKIGSNRRDAALWVEWLERNGIEYERVMPVRSKVKAGYFKALTGWKGSTNEHGRDAGMLVWGR
jgi:hypothetical protein